MLLENIHSPQDIKGFSPAQRQELAQQMRTALLKRASIHGGHVGPDLGFVETAIALHTVFNSPTDKFVFDVSHQAYPHKMLTGRMQAYIDEAHYDDVSGYTNPEESPHDFFNVGHTSTSISLASGLAKARDLMGAKENIIAIIGDGSMSGGEAFEGLNFLAELKTNFIVVFNDNDMSIAENHGGIYQGFKKLRDHNGQTSDNLFKALGLDYRYVADGHDIEALIKAFQEVKDIDHPVVVHIHTIKGKGYKYAEEDRESWHFHMPFDLKTGEMKQPYVDEVGQATASHLLAKMKTDPTLAVITSAVPMVFGFYPPQRKEAGAQFVDVGIAEEQGVAMASGIAKRGGHAIYGTYSTFAQRTYDQMVQDVCVNNNPATFLIFGASMFALNDVTHLGIFDIPLFANIPNLVHLAPTNMPEYFAMLDWSIEQNAHPVMIRVPWDGGEELGQGKLQNYDDLNKYEIVHQGSRVAFIGLGTFYARAHKAAELLKKDGIDATLINPRYISGVDEEALEALKKDHELIITLEDGSLDGGYGGKVARRFGGTNIKVKSYGLPKAFYDRYDANQLARQFHLDPDQIAEDVRQLLK